MNESWNLKKSTDLTISLRQLYGLFDTTKTKLKAFQHVLIRSFKKC